MTVIQRFGGGLNLNVHFHTLVLDGVFTLKTPWADGTRHLLFAPMELLEKVAALTPRPRINLILDHGVLPRTRAGAPAWWPTALSPGPQRQLRISGVIGR